MSNRLGIVTRYRQDESTYAAVQLAEFYENQGYCVEIYARYGACPTLFPAWDHAVIRSASLPLGAWLATLDQVIWTDVPNEDELSAGHAVGAATAVLLASDNVVVSHLPSLTIADRLITTSKTLSKAIARRSSHRLSTILVPWYLPVAKVKPAILPKDQVSICVPLMDTQLNRTSLRLFDVLEALLQAESSIHVGVLRSSGWCREARKKLRRFILQFPGRIAVCSDKILEQRQRFICKHHFSLWGAHLEGLNSFGLLSLASGVPVVAWDVPPINELLHETNGLLLTCKTEQNGLSWVAVPDYADMLERVLALARDPDRVSQLASNCHNGLAIRMAAYKRGLSTLWD